MIIIKENNRIYFSYSFYQSIYTNLSNETLNHEENLMACKMHHHPNTWLLVDDDIFVRDLFKYELKLPDEMNILSIQQEVIPQMKALLEFYNVNVKYQLSGNYVIIHEGIIYSISKYQFVKEIETVETLGYFDTMMRLILEMYKELDVSERLHKVYDFLRRAYKAHVPEYEVIEIK